MITSSALLILLTTQPAAAPPPSAAEEIVVIANQLKTWKGKITPAGAALRCVTTVSTGDAEVDRIGCGAMVACFTPLRTRMEAASNRRRPIAERRALTAAIEQELGACLPARHEPLIADLIERRYQARQGTSDASN